MGDIIEAQYLTPTPRKQGQSITMSFPDAIREIIAGNKVKRLSWEAENDYGLLKDGWLTIYTKGVFHSWLVNDGDLEGEDWVVVKEEN